MGMADALVLTLFLCDKLRCFIDLSNLDAAWKRESWDLDAGTEIGNFRRLFSKSGFYFLPAFRRGFRPSLLRHSFSSFSPQLFFFQPSLRLPLIFLPLPCSHGGEERERSKPELKRKPSTLFVLRLCFDSFDVLIDRDRNQFIPFLASFSIFCIKKYLALRLFPSQFYLSFRFYRTFQISTDSVFLLPGQLDQCIIPKSFSSRKASSAR